MTRALILLAALALMVFAVFGLARPSFAQEPRCAPHNAIATALARTFSETVVAIGLASNGQMVEVYASPKGTWTIVLTLPTGQSCMVASGTAFEQIIVKLQPQGVPG